MSGPSLPPSPSSSVASDRVSYHDMDSIHEEVLPPLLQLINPFWEIEELPDDEPENLDVLSPHPPLEDNFDDQVSVNSQLESPHNIPPSRSFPFLIYPWMIALCSVIVTMTTLLLVLLLVLRPTNKSNPCIQTFAVSDYKTIAAIIEAAPSYSQVRVCIVIGEGQYQENIKVGHDKTNLMFVGEGIGCTTITSNVTNVNDPATLWVVGVGFVARDLTVENVGQNGVAVENWGHESVFFGCMIKSLGKSLHMTKSRRMLYRNCHIYGTSYLATGSGNPYFQKCSFRAERTHLQDKIVFIGQTLNNPILPNEFIFHRCSFQVVGRGADRFSVAFIAGMLAESSHIIIMQSTLDDQIMGYIDGAAPKSTYLAVFQNNGPAFRITPNHVRSLQYDDASRFSLRAQFLHLDWIPRGIKYDPELQT